MLISSMSANSPFSFLVPAILSLLHLALFGYYNSLYRNKRRGEVYRDGRALSFVQMPLKRKITKLAFGANVLLVLVSLFFVIVTGPTSAPISTYAGFLDVSIYVRVLGLAISAFGVWLLRLSLSYLAENYSPLFDSHRPFRIVQEGPYRKVRHPVYLSNMLIILGYVVMGASIWSLLLGAWGWFYMAWSITQEEKVLATSFPEYEAYKKTSYRLIPFIY